MAAAVADHKKRRDKMAKNKQTQAIQNQSNSHGLTAKSAKEIEALLEQAEQNQGEWIELGLEYCGYPVDADYVFESYKVFVCYDCGKWRVSEGPDYCEVTSREEIESSEYF